MANAKQRRKSGRVQDHAMTADGFANFGSRLGWGTGNQGDGAFYNFANRATVRRLELEGAYRQSWIVGMAIDAPADDMTRAGIEIESTLAPDEMERMESAILDLGISQSFSEAIKWGRLFGGCIMVPLIDGQDMETPLRIETIGEGAFRGLYAFERWRVLPSINDLVQDFGPDFGKPKYYTVTGDTSVLAYKKIHHSRVIRFDGIELPYFQKRSEMGWGESVLERLWDRLTAFDSTTLGAAQLAYKAHLRTYSVEGLREILAAGGPAKEALLQQIQFLRQTQTNEGMTLMDASDKFEAHTYTFSGLSDVILQFAQQLSGALQIPLVRLFGQSPGGLNSSGESDLRTYYDGIAKEQEKILRRPWNMVLDMIYRSLFNQDPPQGFKFRFVTLWQTSDAEKATIGQTVTNAVTAAYDAGLVSPEIALKELRSSARQSGMWSTITDEDIEDAASAPPRAELGPEADRQDDTQSVAEKPED